MTKFSIVIPCFNAVATLPQTLDAIRAQSYGDWEVLCIDDGSTDLTRALIEHYNALDPRIQLNLNDGKGPSRARNVAALSLARGDVIAFCDADDIWTPDKLVQLAICFSDPCTDAVFGQIAFFDETPEDATTFSSVPKERLNIPMLLGENPVCTMSNIALRTDAFRQTGGFDEEMVHNEDLDWLIRLVGDGARVVGLDALHTYYRASPNGLSGDLAAMRAGRRAALKTADRYGYEPSRKSNAIYLRYLARRALRLGQGRFAALCLALEGIITSPIGFFSSPKRGALTLLAALATPFLPERLSRRLFA